MSGTLPYYTGTAAFVDQTGINWAVNAEVRDGYGGLYEVTSVDTAGHPTAVKILTAPTVAGLLPGNPMPTVPVSGTIGLGGLFLDITWKQVPSNSVGVFA